MTLNAGECYSLRGYVDISDEAYSRSQANISGTRIVTSRPVGVVAGVPRIVPANRNIFGMHDAIVEIEQVNPLVQGVGHLVVVRASYCYTVALPLDDHRDRATTPMIPAHEPVSNRPNSGAYMRVMSPSR